MLETFAKVWVITHMSQTTESFPLYWHTFWLLIHECRGIIANRLFYSTNMTRWEVRVLSYWFVLGCLASWQRLLAGAFGLIYHVMGCRQLLLPLGLVLSLSPEVLLARREILSVSVHSIKWASGWIHHTVPLCRFTFLVLLLGRDAPHCHVDATDKAWQLQAKSPPLTSHQQWSCTLGLFQIIIVLTW